MFHAFGCTLKEEYPCTLFRLPLRTTELAKDSQLSNRSHSVPSMNNLRDAFLHESANLLLFLKSVELVEWYHWKPTFKEPELIVSTSIKDVSPEVRGMRSFLQRTPTLLNVSGNQKVYQSLFELQIVVETFTGNTGQQSQFDWLVSNQLGGHTEVVQTFCSDPDHEFLRLLPWYWLIFFCLLLLLSNFVWRKVCIFWLAYDFWKLWQISWRKRKTNRSTMFHTFSAF